MIFEIWLNYSGSGSHFDHGVAHYPDGTARELTGNRLGLDYTIVSDGKSVLIWHDYSFEIEIRSWDAAIEEIIFRNETEASYEIYPYSRVHCGEPLYLKRTERYDEPVYCKENYINLEEGK